MRFRAPQMLVLGMSIFALCSCGSIPPSDVIDPSGDLTRDDYLDLRHRQEKAPKPHAELSLPPIPNLTEAVPAPVKLPGHGKRVSVTVTDNVPLRDVLIELAHEAKVNLELDPRVQGGIIFSAHEQPFDDVLRRTGNGEGAMMRYIWLLAVFVFLRLSGMVTGFTAKILVLYYR